MVSHWTSMCLFVRLSICQLYIHPSPHPSVFFFLDDNLSKHQWIFTKLGMCIDIVKIWFLDCWWASFVKFLQSYLPETCPYFCFRMITWINVNGFSPNLVCASILQISGLGLLTSKFWQSYLPKTCPYFRFPDDNLSKCQEILTKLGKCIDVKEIWFGIAYGQILSMFDRVICPRHDNGGVS